MGAGEESPTKHFLEGRGYTKIESHVQLYYLTLREGYSHRNLGMAGS